MSESSLTSTRPRPRDLNTMDYSGCHVTPPLNASRAKRVAYSPIMRLLNDIAFQWQKEQDNAIVNSGRRTRQHRDDDDAYRTATTRSTTTGAVSVPNLNDHNEYDEAASAYWWTNLFLRHFVFDGNSENETVAADSDDLLFFVRRRYRRDKHKSKHRCRPSSQRPRLVAYDTRVYRKQQSPKQTTMLPISDPAVLWRHTVCLNTIIHRVQYTLTVAVCARVPRKSALVADVDYNNYDENAAEFELGFDDGQDEQYDLQVLSRHVHTVYASTSGRRMDTDKGPKERPVYPALCWAADDYAEAFRTVIVCPGQTVCVELVASWLGSTVVAAAAADDKHANNDDYGDDDDGATIENSADALLNGRNFTPVTKKNRAVLFSGAIPYAAVRATYECKMSLYRDAERERRKRRQRDRKRICGKTSSLGAALSASLTALFTGAKDSSDRRRLSANNNDDNDDEDGYYCYGTAAAAAAADGRVEYVTVRGCHPGRDDDDDGGGDGGGGGGDYEPTSDDDENDFGLYTDHDTKGLAQMAVTLAPIQPPFETNISPAAGHYEYGEYSAGNDVGEDVVDVVGYDYEDGMDRYGADRVAAQSYDDVDADYVVGGHRQQSHHHKRQLEPSSYAAPSTASEPGDYYDYGWDYETAVSSGHQTPQTPVSYHYQQQQQQQLERQRRRGGRPRRLSDPCSTSVYDLIDDDGGGGGGGWTPQCFRLGAGNRRKQQYNYQQQQPTINSYGGSEITTSVMTPGRWLPHHHRHNRAQRPHRAWSESDGLDRCGGGGGDGVTTKHQRRQYPLPLPPPPVPYYCAAEATASGFVQYARKSATGWRMRTKKKSERRRGNASRRKSRNDFCGGRKKRSADECRSRSAGENDGDSDSDGGDDDTDSDGGGDSDGEFIGTLAAAAAVGHDPEREWGNDQRTVAGNPVADWERYGDDSDSSSVADDADADAAMIEWTVEILATDLRRDTHRNAAAAFSVPIHRDDFGNWHGGGNGPLPLTPAGCSTSNRHQQQQQQQQRGRHRQQPQLRPQPLEPPPPPPALSVAFTAVACPWWTVLKDLTSANTAEIMPSTSTRTKFSRLPLLTFD